jgi:hypothetical protein
MRGITAYMVSDLEGGRCFLAKYPNSNMTLALTHGVISISLLFRCSFGVKSGVISHIIKSALSRFLVMHSKKIGQFSMELSTSNISIFRSLFLRKYSEILSNTKVVVSL